MVTLMQGDGTLAKHDRAQARRRINGESWRTICRRRTWQWTSHHLPHVTLPGKPTRMGIWALGDGSGNYLSASFRDKDGELFKVRLRGDYGSRRRLAVLQSRRSTTITLTGRRQAAVPPTGSPTTRYSLSAFRLENTPDEPAGSGTIYLDDLQTWEGPDVSSVRFNRE